MSCVIGRKAEHDIETYIILSAGKADVIAEMTSVRHDLTFSVIPSLSIMIIYSTKVQRGSLRARIPFNDTHMCPSLQKHIGPINQPLGVPSASTFKFCHTCIPASSPLNPHLRFRFQPCLASFLH